MDYPDSLGIACHFRPHGVILLGLNTSVANHPNYYLGASPQPCWGVGIGEGEAEEAVWVYPNPTRDKLYVGMNHIAQGAVLTLSNSLGQILSHKTLENTPTETEISLGHLPAGIYYLQIQAENQIFTEKIMKE
jgi:hypothetical protein